MCIRDRRIEILRGPQPTYFGRNVVGGAISVTMNKPNAEKYGRLAGELSRFGTYELDGIVNIPLSDTFFLRGSASWETSDGNIKNINAAGGTNSHDYTHFRLAARWLASD